MNLGGLHLEESLVKAIKEMGYTEFTGIQLKTIPEIQKGKDIIGQSKTGSGKTAAFGLPILEKIVHGKGIQALVLTPTRELCVQVANSMRDFAKHKHTNVVEVYGGVSINPQIQALRSADVVVGTPGRILDHSRQRTVDFSKVRFFVIDETDRMADMGFIYDVEKIIRLLPANRQTLLFSATITNDVDNIARNHMKSPVSIKSETFVEKALLAQEYYDVAQPEKFSVLVHLLKQNNVGLSLVFCRTRSEVDLVARNLKMNKLNALAIHGGLTQGKRLRALESLQTKDIDILVATDVAARGLDIKGVNFIYNYDVPESQEDYIHRMGRTARAGASGKAITLLGPADHMRFRIILRNSSIQIKNIPTPEVEHIIFHRHLRHDRNESQSSTSFHSRRPSGGRGFSGGRGRGGFGHGRFPRSEPAEGSYSSNTAPRSSAYGSDSRPHSGGHNNFRKKRFGNRQGGFRPRSNQF